MKKSFTLLCSILLIGAILSGCTSSKVPASSTVSPSTSSAVQNSGTSEKQNITLEKDKISKDVVFRKTSSADGKIVLTSDQIEKIEMKPSQTAQNPNIFAITFYLTEEGSKQFSLASRDIVETKEEMSIWGKNGKVASAELTDPIEGGIFVLNGSYSLEEAKEYIKAFSNDGKIAG